MISKATIIFFLFFSALFSGVTASAFAQAKTNFGPEQKVAEFSLSGIGEQGKKSWDITGKSADIDGNLIKLNDIESNFYGDEENVKLTADKGGFNREQGQLHLEKDVVVTTDSGAKLTTNSLDWDKETKTVTTQDAVNIEKQDMRITAQGAKGYSDLKKVDLEKDVQVEIQSAQNSAASDADKKTKTVINCDGPLQIDYKENIATFHNNVRVETQDALITSDTMEVYFLGHKEPVGTGPAVAGTEIEKIIARGNVKITRGENVSYSDEAVYSALDRKVTLSGKPRLIIYSDKEQNASFGN